MKNLLIKWRCKLKHFLVQIMFSINTIQIVSKFSSGSRLHSGVLPSLYLSRTHHIIHYKDNKMWVPHNMHGIELLDKHESKKMF